MRPFKIPVLPVCFFILAAVSCRSTPSAALAPEPSAAVPPVYACYKIKQTSFYPDGKPDAYTVYTYAGEYDAVLTEEVRNASDNTLRQKTVNTYNGGFLTESSVTDRNGALLEKTLFEYTGGVLTLKTSLDAAGKIQSIRRYTYNAGNQIAKIEILDDGRRPVSATVYTYGADGFLQKAVILDAAGMLFSSITYEYRNGLKIKETLTDADGANTQVADFSYTAGGLLARQKYLKNGKLKNTVEYTYGKYNELLTGIEKSASGKTVNTVIYEYDIVTK